MKVVHVITRLVAGGAQRNTLLCAAEQRARGHQVVVISGVQTSSEGCLLAEARQADYELVEMASLVREISPAKDLAALMQLYGYLRHNRCDVLHTHTSKAGLLGRIAGALAGVPVIVHTPHGHIFHSYFSRSKEMLFRWLERLVAPLADMQVMLSPGDLRDHLREGITSAGRLCVIPSGVPLQRFLQCAPLPKEGPVVIGFLGRLADIKGPLDLVEAFALLHPKFPEWRLLLVGDGPQRDQVDERVLRLGLQDYVRITGWQADTLPYLSEMDVLCVPSHNEGMGRVVVEAMACGLPVVATRVGGLPDLVRHNHNGKLCRPKQPGDLAEQLADLLQLPDRGRTLGQRGREMAHQYSDQVMFERLEQLYERLTVLKRYRTL